MRSEGSMGASTEDIMVNFQNVWTTELNKNNFLIMDHPILALRTSALPYKFTSYYLL